MRYPPSCSTAFVDTLSTSLPASGSVTANSTDLAPWQTDLRYTLLLVFRTEEQYHLAPERHAGIELAQPDQRARTPPSQYRPPDTHTHAAIFLIHKHTHKSEVPGLLQKRHICLLLPGRISCATFGNSPSANSLAAFLCPSEYQTVENP